MPEEEKIVIAMSRPPFPPDTKYTDPETGEIKYGAVLICPCGHHLWYRETVFQHWQMGHFDTPVYCTRQELIEAKLKQIEERRNRPLQEK